MLYDRDAMIECYNRMLSVSAFGTYLIYRFCPGEIRGGLGTWPRG